MWHEWIRPDQNSFDPTEHRGICPDAQREREPLDLGGGEYEQDERGHDRDYVGVDDRRQPLAIAGGDPGADGASGADLLLDPFEDDDVRVGGDTDGEDQAGDSRQGQGDRDQLDQRVEVERVGSQRGGGDQAQDPVVEDQEQRHHQQADGSRDQALVERLLAQRRRHLRL